MAGGIMGLSRNMGIQFGKTIIVSALIILIGMPFSVSAAPSAGIKPSSFFYFLDIAAERVNLFFTFNPEKKARKALEYADERLAEVEEVAEDKNTNAVKTAITNYESNIAFAAEKSKDIGEKEKAEALLTTISDSTSRHQEVLADVLAKVPDEAKEAITKAIEASKKSHEEALQKIAELKGEVEQLKRELAELKAKDEERGKVIEELTKQKAQSPATPQSISTPRIPVTPTQKTEPVQPQPSPKTEAPKINIVTLPNGAVVEMDVNGNIIRTIKEAPVNTTNPIFVQVVQPMPITPKPEITKFEASKYTASLGDEITLSWDTKNAVICAISETRDISIPFTGRLPAGTTTFTLAETAYHKRPADFNYYAICADKDWNTSVKELTISVPYNPRFTDNFKIVRSYIGSAGEFHIEGVVDFVDASAIGVVCYSISGNEIWRTNRIPPPDALGNANIGFFPNNGFDWDSTYNCTANLQQIEGTLDNGKLTNLPIYQNFSFTTPLKQISQ